MCGCQAVVSALLSWILIQPVLVLLHHGMCIYPTAWGCCCNALRVVAYVDVQCIYMHGSVQWDCGTTLHFN